MPEIDPAELLNDHDIKILRGLSTHIYNIWSKEIEEDKRERVYDNVALDAFMSVFTLMIDDFTKNKNIKNYISHAYGGPRIAIDAPIRYGYDTQLVDSK